MSLETSQNSKVHNKQEKLLKNYKSLIEQAYNFRYTDSALSDISEYKAIKILNEINRLSYLHRDRLQFID